MDAEAERQFRELVQTRWTTLVRYAYLLTGDRAEAEDAVQSALEKCWRRWSRVRADRPEAYLRRAITTTVISRHRWRSRRPAEAPLDPGELSDRDAPVLGDGAEHRAVRSLLRRELRSLPPRMRAVVVLRLWEDLPEIEVAHLLGCSVGTVKSQLSRGLDRLRERPEVRGLLGADVARPPSSRPPSVRPPSIPDPSAIPDPCARPGSAGGRPRTRPEGLPLGAPVPVTPSVPAVREQPR